MKDTLAKKIGAAARAARKALQLTQEDTAERLNVSVEFYARIERGTSLPSIVTFANIVRVLGVSGDALLGRPGAPAVAPMGIPSWAPAPPNDGPELRRLARRLRKSSPATLRAVNLLLREIENITRERANDPAND